MAKCIEMDPKAGLLKQTLLRLRLRLQLVVGAPECATLHHLNHSKYAGTKS